MTWVYFMYNHYVISDNQYFSLGVTSLIAGHTCVSLVPEDITPEQEEITSGIVLIYIKDRNKFRSVCRYLSSSVCELIFFFEPSPSLEFCDIISARFWNAKLSTMAFSNRIPRYWRYTAGDIFANVSAARRRRLSMAAKGLKHYNSWVLTRTRTPKRQHDYNRSLLLILGIKQVSVYHLSLAEKMSLACMTVYNEQSRRRQLDESRSLYSE